MNRGILFAVVVALAWSGLSSGCRRPADTGQLRAVDSLQTTMDKNLHTLMQLDQQVYVDADSIFKARSSDYLTIFADTLDPITAKAASNQYLVLREAERVGLDHRNLYQELSTTQQRLTHFRNDINSGAMDNDAAHVALLEEQLRARAIERETATIASNHFTVKYTLEELRKSDTTSTSKTNKRK